MPEVQNRRPLASRKARWAGRIARWLVGTGITPNQISCAGMVAALLGGVCFWAAGQAGGAGRAMLFLGAALFVQLRLLCNLFDGMVAIEGGRGSADGGFWNEFPDRVSDMLILVGIGLGVNEPVLGWAATSLAFLTAYLRELGVSCGAGADFSGPMAKQHRMALVTLAACVSAAAAVWTDSGRLMIWALWILIVGTSLTVVRRAWRLVAKLRRGGVTGPS